VTLRYNFQTDKGKGKIYHLHETFDSFELAHESLLSERIWSKTNKKYEKSTKSHKVFYRCNQVKSRSKIQCPTACVIIKLATSTKAEVHRTVCAHDHIQKSLEEGVEARLAIDKMFISANVYNMKLNSDKASISSSINTDVIPYRNACFVQDYEIEKDDVALPIQVAISLKAATIKRRGRPPLSEEEKNRRAAEKALKAVAKRALKS